MNRIIGALFLAVAIFFTFAIQWSARRQNDAHERFQSVSAEVVSSRVRSNRSSSGSTSTTSYSPEVTYRYTVDGQTHTSKRFCFMGAGHSTYESAEQASDAYPVGGSVTAFYDPSDPLVSVLSTAPMDLTMLNVATLSVWGVIIGTGLYVVWRRKRKQSAASEAWPVSGQVEPLAHA